MPYSSFLLFGTKKSIIINKRGVSGKIVALTIVTDKNEFTIYKECDELLKEFGLTKEQINPILSKQKIVDTRYSKEKSPG